MTHPGSPNGHSPFGGLLRHWRQARGLSQLALATDADTSSRHLSFLETGRTRPSREMVRRLATVLDLRFDEQNAMLLAAGYAPAFGMHELGAPELAHVRRALTFILKQQEPFPALVVDGGWDIVMRNDAVARIFGRFRGASSPGAAVLNNALHATFHPDGLRQFIVNWEELAGPLLHIVHREAAASERAARLRDALLAYPGVPRRWKVPDPEVAAAPVLSMRLKRNDLSLAFFSTITTLATPQDVTLQQLRIECFHPADAATEETARRLAAAA